MVSEDGFMATALTPGEHADRFSHTDFDGKMLLEFKEDRRIAVCIPARNEATTVGPVVDAILSTLGASSGDVPLIDEVVVTDDGSTDRTAAEAAEAGARVIAAEAPHGGKGQAMRSALQATDADLIAFVDADVTNFEPHFVTGLLGPLLTTDHVALVKGFYTRPLHGDPTGGGRVRAARASRRQRDAFRQAGHQSRAAEVGRAYRRNQRRP